MGVHAEMTAWWLHGGYDYEEVYWSSILPM